MITESIKEIDTDQTMFSLVLDRSKRSERMNAINQKRAALINQCSRTFYSFIDSHPDTWIRYYNTNPFGHYKHDVPRGVLVMSLINNKLYLGYSLCRLNDKWNKTMGRALAVEQIINATSNEGFDSDKPIIIASEIDPTIDYERDNYWIKSLPHSLRDTAFKLYKCTMRRVTRLKYQLIEKNNNQLIMFINSINDRLSKDPNYGSQQILDDIVVLRQELSQ